MGDFVHGRTDLHTHFSKPNAHHPTLHSSRIVCTKTAHSFGVQVMELRMLKVILEKQPLENTCSHWLKVVIYNSV